MSKPCWTRLVRFIAQEDGKEYYGQPTCSKETDVGELFLSGKLKAKVLKGDPLSSNCSFEKPERVLSVKKLLAPVDVPRYGASIRCLGTNYPIGKATKPPVPILFLKPYTCLAGFGDKIYVPKDVQAESDYEVELVIVIGKEGRNISKGKAFDHIVGYTICNDITARKRMFATSQWGMGKVLDGWLPLGPCLVAASEFKDPQDLILKAQLATHHANKNPLQNASTKHMLWQIAETVSALSYATTLKVGDIIATGTPPGQGSAQKPPIFLQHGEKVTVWGEGIGSLVNEVEWEGGAPKRDSKL